ncbi:hypothetical protein ASPZODRAFT_153041 [Penicilliopsis zonata CBS 506.65]|uniref:LEM-like domain-containing protein n=1 Tax=Penicilliopsis zonata CBS 506.65 TaxID=1073090 RepID=A0A1L9SDX6_9EURO|nr:hypothetical protein ASPZODRAFT_153041 [Penicilliopsis zonata CBS 506.65]OJJ45381.1 hypothetical protein ASPZODRAFT_153041 [Penicilliopsis zonata CBS 506.65]
MADEYEYLAADFDLNSLTVPRLRSILVNHDVPYPASAKKAQLIRILQDEVLPQARRLLRERERVRRTSEGIMDMGSRASSVVSDFDDETRGSRAGTADRESRPSTTVSRGRSSRQSTRASTAEEEGQEASGIPATPSTAGRRRMGARGVHKHPRASDTETGDDETLLATPVVARDRTSPRKSTARKLRKSEVVLSSTEPEYNPPPQAKTESLSRDGSVFTDDNPFQSGSSPTSWDHQHTPQPLSHDRRRKSTSRFSTGSPGHALRTTTRRQPDLFTPVKQEDGITVPSRASFEFPVSQFRAHPVEEEEEEEEGGEGGEYEDTFGEEFTPEEQLALESSQAETRYPVRATQQQQQGALSRWAPWIVIFSLFGGFGAWWRQEKIEIGFCGIGKPTWSLAETKVPEWAGVLEPSCEPCPAHAFCYPNFEADCEHDFLLKRHPLSLGGLVPLPPTCEPDSEKARRVKAVADKAVEELRDRRAKFECGGLTGEDGMGAKSPEILEAELKKAVASKRRRGMSDVEFDDLWKGALGEIIGRDEVVSQTLPSGIVGLSSSSIARLPLTCAFRRHLRLSLLAYRLPVSIIMLLGCVGVYARSRILARRSDQARVPDLVATTLDRLATQAALHARGGAHEPYISIGQLRDDVLRSELHGRRREELWKRVRTVVEGNANVRAAVREGRGGDVARVWEWIGGIGSVGACTGGNPCSECSLHGRECIFNESGDRRRKLSAKRVASELEWYIQFVDQLLKTIREGNQTTVDLVVDSIRSGTSVEDLKTLLNNYLPQSRGGLQMGPAPEPSDTPPMHSDASSRNQEDHS